MKRFLFIIILLFTMLLVGCDNQPLENHNSEMQAHKVIINATSIANEIARSNMPDAGYRFVNAEYSGNLSAYATHYIREAKDANGLLSEKDNLDNEEKMALVEKFLMTNNLDLTDIYCTLLLVNSKVIISDSIKNRISVYIDSLYDEDIGCYTIVGDVDGDTNAINMYPTFIVYSISSLLDIETKPVNNWLEKVQQELISSNSPKQINSRTYVMLLQLLNSHGMKISEASANLIFQMFEDSLKNVEMLKNSTEVYLPVYLMDFLEFCVLADYDSTPYHSTITELICDDNGIKDNLIVEYDTYGLYSSVRALELSGFDFDSVPEIKNTFDMFDKFLLSDSLYIAPGFAESNFVDTYYADALVTTMKINFDNSIESYCVENKDAILETDAINIYYYIELLRRNGLLSVIDENKQDISDMLLSTFSSILTTEGATNTYLPTLNATIKGLDLLGQEYLISETQAISIIERFIENENKQQLVYDLTEIIEFIHLIYDDNQDLLWRYCVKLENELVNLSATDVSNKIMLYKKAVCAFKDSDYVLTDKLRYLASEILAQAQDSNGLFKGGDSNEDVVSFRSTYDAIILYQSINE